MKHSIIPNIYKAFPSAFVMARKTCTFTMLLLIVLMMTGCGNTTVTETSSSFTQSDALAQATRAADTSSKVSTDDSSAEKNSDSGNPSYIADNNSSSESDSETFTKYPEGTTKITVTGGNEEEGDFIEINYIPDAKMNSYKDECWDYNEYGYKIYTENGYTCMVGIDLSGYVTEVDWEQIKTLGIDYVITRLGYRGYGTGALVMDDMFDSHVQGALNAGLKVGVYFFSQALNAEEAIEEANYCLEHIAQYDIEMPVYFDTEKIKNDTARTDNMTKDDYTEACVAFCETVKAAGYTPGVYANQVWFTSMLDLKQVEDYNIWFAKYRELPDYPYKFDCWQYSESGEISGVNGAVDLNVWMEK